MCQPGMGHSGATTVLERPAKKSVALGSGAEQSGLETGRLPRVPERALPAPASESTNVARVEEPKRNPVAEPNAAATPPATPKVLEARQERPKQHQGSADRAPSQKSMPANEKPVAKPVAQKPVTAAPAAPQRSVHPSSSVRPPSPSAHQSPPPPAKAVPVAPPAPMTRDQGLQGLSERKIPVLAGAKKVRSERVEAPSTDVIPEEYLGTVKLALKTVLSQAIFSERSPRFRERNEAESVLRRLYKLAWNRDPQRAELLPQNAAEFKSKILKGIQLHLGEEFSKTPLPKFLQ